MNSIVIKPTKLKGVITPPPSKSLSHRAIISASLSKEKEISIIDNVILSEDIKATINGMKSLGAEIEIINNWNNSYKLHIGGIREKIEYAEIDCKESGSTLRFLIPIALMLTKSCKFSGRGKLVERPLDLYYQIFDEKNIKYKNIKGNLPLTISGKLKEGSYKISGQISSQFISGLLFALPLTKKESVITITDKMESAPYVDLTIEILKRFGINIESNYRQYIVRAGSQYKSSSYTVEADYSQAAFYLVAKALGNDVECVGLNEDSLQGDKEILNIIERYTSNAQEIIIDASQIPDLVPIITVLASLQKGKVTRIINAQRLRIKESDRLKAISTEMNKIGGEIEESKDGLYIVGKENLKGKTRVNSWNDHRIAMSLAIAATKCKDEIILENYQAVNKSYPGFWNDYMTLGGLLNGFNMGK
ncbi:MAG: 3-phosphoshikimate 1-carboxyvinyltransferase [Tissierellia bacterium]|nr:3-phosphoshikimate 1-carboxyvinyltransferase [Tissierellia bacterium]